VAIDRLARRDEPATAEVVECAHAIERDVAVVPVAVVGGRGNDLDHDQIVVGQRVHDLALEPREATRDERHVDHVARNVARSASLSTVAPLVEPTRQVSWAWARSGMHTPSTPDASTSVRVNVVRSITTASLGGS
jgi:hypothetical protein